ncbi:MAG: MFS transporter [Gorillibacterium sp.]|nr:MFS transporter [Gorillibacterium sp.]
MWIHKLKNRLQHTPFLLRLFISGHFISRLGDSLYSFAVPWISYELTGSALVMGSLYAVSVLPVVLFGPFVGVYVDRWDRKKLMIGIDLARMVLVALLPVLHTFDLLTLGWLYATGFTLSLLTMAYEVSIVAITPDLASGDLTQANSGIQTVNQLADMLGPAFAGGLTAILGAINILWLDVLSFGLVLFMLTQLPANRKSKRIMTNVFKEMKDGLHWLTQHSVNLALSIQAAVGNFGYSAAYSVLTYYLITVFHLNSNQVGINYSLLAAGGVIGSIGIVALDKRYARGKLITSLLIVGFIGFMFAALCPVWFAPGIGFAIVGACNVGWSIITASIRQETVPAHLLGRVLSFSRVITRTAMPAGALLGGLLSGTLHPATVFLLAAFAKLIEVVIAYLSPIRKLI